MRATVVGRVLPGLDHGATVTARAADALARTADTKLTCVPGGEFADRVELKATYKGAAAGKVAATATLLGPADATAGDAAPRTARRRAARPATPPRTPRAPTSRAPATRPSAP